MTMTFAEAQAWLASNGARLSGSRALGLERDDSDWDYYLPHSKVKRLARWLTANGEPWTSCVTGHVAFWPEGIRIEVSDIFPRCKTKGKED